MDTENTIETDRLIIRPVQLIDVHELHTSIFSNDELMATGIYLGRALSYEETQQFVEEMCRTHRDSRYISPSVFLLKQTNELVGYGGLSSKTNWGDLFRTTDERLDVEIFYVFKKVYWGMGLATEMAKAMIDYALNRRGADRVWTSIQARNKASQRVVEKAGMNLVQKTNHDGGEIHVYAVARE
ncbi:MAG: GNAT family N-acetyltransferase [Caldilineaceae bacterium]